MIYVCTSVSDHRICGVFDNKGLAEKFCQKVGCDIEEWKLNPFANELEKGYSFYSVRMSKKGKVQEVRKINLLFDLEVDEGIQWIDRNAMCFQCVAMSREHAVELTNEKRLIAFGPK